VEDNYNSKQKDLKNFKENLISFWDNLVLECQNGPLLDDILCQKIKDYVIVLSSPPFLFIYRVSLYAIRCC
jgi:cohesin complex subunit SA-1/2